MVLNIILIPRFAAVGAAIGTVAAELVVLLVQCLALREEVPYLFRQVQYGKVLAGLAAAGLAAVGVLSLHLSNLQTLILGACAFFGGYGAVLLLTKESFVIELCSQIYNKAVKRRR